MLFETVTWFVVMEKMTRGRRRAARRFHLITIFCCCCCFFASGQH